MSKHGRSLVAENDEIGSIDSLRLDIPVQSEYPSDPGDSTQLHGAISPQVADYLQFANLSAAVEG